MTRFRRPTLPVCSHTPLRLRCSAPWSATRSHMSLLLDLDHLPVRLHFLACQPTDPAHFGPLVSVLLLTANASAIHGQERTTTASASPPRPVSASCRARWSMRATIAPVSVPLSGNDSGQRVCGPLRGGGESRQSTSVHMKVAGVLGVCWDAKNVHCWFVTCSQLLSSSSQRPSNTPNHCHSHKEER